LDERDTGVLQQFPRDVEQVVRGCGVADDFNLAGRRRIIATPPEPGPKEKSSVDLASGAGRNISRCPATGKLDRPHTLVYGTADFDHRRRETPATSTHRV
jgi:hypothetical protein